MPPPEPARDPVRKHVTPAGVDMGRPQPRGSVAEDYDADTDVSELTSPTIRPTAIPPRLLQDIGRKDSGHSVLSTSSKNSELLSQASIETGNSQTSTDASQTDASQLDATQTDTSACARSDTSSQAHQSDSLSSSDAASMAVTVQSSIRHSVSIESPADSTVSKPITDAQGSDCTTLTLPTQAITSEKSESICIKNSFNSSPENKSNQDIETQKDSIEMTMSNVPVPKPLSSIIQGYNSGIEDISPASSPISTLHREAETVSQSQSVQPDINQYDDVKMVEREHTAVVTEAAKSAAASAAAPRKQLSLQAYRLKKKAQSESRPPSAPNPIVSIPSPTKSVSDLTKSPPQASPTKSVTLLDEGLSSPVSSHTSTSVSSTKHGIAESLRKTSEWLKASKAAFEQEQRQELKLETAEREMRDVEVSSQSSLSTSVSEKQPEPAARVTLASYKARLQKEVGQVKPPPPQASSKITFAQKPEVSEHLVSHKLSKPVKSSASAERQASVEPTLTSKPPSTLAESSSHSVQSGTQGSEESITVANSRTIADLSRVKSLVDSVLAQGSGGKKSTASRELLLKKVG